MKNILCFSRSYLAYLMPEFQKYDSENKYLFIVQTNKEERIVKEKKGNIVFNIERYIKQHLNKKTPEVWEEPKDFREVTNFFSSPIYSDRYLVNFQSKRRNEIAGGLLLGFSKLFEENKIDYFVGEPVAIFSTHLLFYLTKKNGGKPRLWSSTFFPGYFYFSENVVTSTPVQSNKKLLNNDLEEKINEVKNYFKGIIDDTKGPWYHYSFAKKRSVFDTFFKTRKGVSPIVVQTGIVSIALQFLRYFRSLIYKCLFPYIGDFQTAASNVEHKFYLKALLTSKSIYDKVPKEYEKDAIVFPIQYEPEATLLYFAPIYSNQYVVVENILKSLPHGKILYLKEHPNQFGVLGLSKWRKLKKTYSNVKFIYGRESGRELIKKTNFSVCISSSLGMDTLLFGKKVVLLGDVYYQNFTGTHKVYSFLELNRVLNDQNTYTYEGHSVDSVMSDFSPLINNSHKGFPYSSKTLFDQDNLKNIARVISTEFR